MILKLILKAIMTRGSAVLWGVVILVLAGAQSCVAAINWSGTVKLSDVPCVADSVSHDDLRVLLNVNCEGLEGAVSDVAFVAGYLETSGPFTCNIYNNDSIKDCKLIE